MHPKRCISGQKWRGRENPFFHSVISIVIGPERWIRCCCCCCYRCRHSARFHGEKISAIHFGPNHRLRLCKCGLRSTTAESVGCGKEASFFSSLFFFSLFLLFLAVLASCCGTVPTNRVVEAALVDVTVRASLIAGCRLAPARLSTHRSGSRVAGCDRHQTHEPSREPHTHTHTHAPTYAATNTHDTT